MTESNFPEGLSFKIIEKELELEHQCTIKVVNELVNMYRQLIEAYESAQDPRFSDFQTRLHKILMRPDVQQMLKNESKYSKKNIKESKEIELQRRNFRSRKTSSMAEQVKISRQLSRYVENRKNIDKNTFSKAKNDIESQNLNLQERLERRKRQSSIQNIRNYQKSYENDYFDGEITDEKQRKLEELMEKSFTEKAEGLEKIKRKYEQKIKKNENNSSSLLEQRDAEIKKHNEDCDQRRKNEIKDFKAKNNLK